MNIKKGDTVKVISGDTRKMKINTGKVIQLFPQENRVLVEGINKVTKHTKPRKMGQQGGRIQKEAPLSASNVMVICPKCKKPTRVGRKIEGEGEKQKKIRVCKHAGCGASLD